MPRLDNWTDLIDAAGGVEAFAFKLYVTRQTVAAWRRKAKVPTIGHHYMINLLAEKLGVTSPLAPLKNFRF